MTHKNQIIILIINIGFSPAWVWIWRIFPPPNWLHKYFVSLEISKTCTFFAIGCWNAEFSNASFYKYMMLFFFKIGKIQAFLTVTVLWQHHFVFGTNKFYSIQCIISGMIPLKYLVLEHYTCHSSGKIFKNVIQILVSLTWNIFSWRYSI